MAGGAPLPVANPYASGSRWVGRAAVLPHNPSAPSWLRFLVLTGSMFGLQLVWSCEMAQASPFLLSLGVSKSMMSIVFLAGPLSGLIVQPLVGVLSDRCKSSLGRRRPFIIAGCACSSLSVLMLGWSKEIAAVFADEGTTTHNHLAIACAVTSVYFIDFSVNVIQAMDRSLLVDVVAPAQQPAANAWAGRMFGFGAVFGYWIGGMDLVWWTGGWLGSEQLKVLTIFTSVLLIGTHAVTVTCVRERILISRGDEHLDGDGGGGGSAGLLRALEDVWHTIRTLPRPIQQVFNVQFAGWIGWFPVLFFSTTWVAEIYVKTRWGDAGTELAQAPDEVREMATRAGTKAMLWHSVVSLVTSIVLPPLVAPSVPASKNDRGGGFSSATTSSALDRLRGFLPRVPFAWLSLPLLWAISNTLFSVLLLSTFFAKSVGSASFIVATAGFAWAVTNWAPFAILGDLILRMGTSPTSLGLSSPGASSVMLHRLDGGNSSAAHLDPSRSSADSWGDEDGASQRMLDSPSDSKQRGRGRSPTPADSLPPTHSIDHAFTLGDDASPTATPGLGSPTFVTAAQTATPQTPTTARSLYFDAPSSSASAAGSAAGDAPAAGTMSRSTSTSTSGRSFASASSGGGSATPTLTASPTLGPATRAAGVAEWGLSATTRARNDSDASSGAYFPPNHGTVGVDLFTGPGGAAAAGGGAGSGAGAADQHAFGADPYAYPAALGVRSYDFGAKGATAEEEEEGEGRAGASSSTVHLASYPREGVAAFGRGGATPRASPAVGGMYALDSDDEGPRAQRGDAHVLQIRHSDSFDLDEHERVHLGGGGGAGRGSAATPRIVVGEGDESPDEWDAQEGEGQGGAAAAQTGGGDQTGVILGCHNIYLVLPQFLVTALSSIIFALFAPHHSVLGHHPTVHHPPPLAGNGTGSSYTAAATGAGDPDGFGDLGERDARRRSLAVRAVRVVGGAMGEAFAAKVRRQDEGVGAGEGGAELPPGGEAGWDALGLIFRVGGIAAACSAYICYRMWRESLQAQRRARSAQRGYRLTG